MRLAGLTDLDEVRQLLFRHRDVLERRARRCEEEAIWAEFGHLYEAE